MEGDMSFRVMRGMRTGVVIVAALSALAACSIQAPNVTLTGGGTGGGTGTTGTGLATSTGATGTGLATSTGATGSGTTGAATGALPNVNDTSCVGKATDTGVTGDQIKLGSTFASSGPVSSISGPIFKGVQSYFNKVNAAGGVFGRKINYVTYDDGWDAQKGKAFIKKLVEQDRVFILSVVPSSNGLDAAKSYLESRHMPVIGSSGLIESQFQSPMQWPVGTSTRSATRILLLKMKHDGVNNAAIIYLDLLAGQEAYEAFNEGIPTILHKSVADFRTSFQRVSISGTNWASVWANVADDTSKWQSDHHQTVTGVPDFIYFAIDPTSAISAIQAAQQKGYKPKIGWGGGQPLYLSVIAQQGFARQTHLLAGTSYYPPQLTQIRAVQDYVATVQHYYGSSVDINNPFLEGGYAGAALTIEAISRAGSCLTKDKVIKVANNFSGYSPAGLTRPLTYSGTSDTNFNHYGNYSYLWAQVAANGQWQVDPNWAVDPTPGK
jgi:branched-chain amino acid transport system substrate-binding protein